MVRFGDWRVNGTILAFRRGRIVGTASIGRGDRRDIALETRRLARALDDRIQADLARELDAQPVALAARRNSAPGS